MKGRNPRKVSVDEVRSVHIKFIIADTAADWKLGGVQAYHDDNPCLGRDNRLQLLYRKCWPIAFVSLLVDGDLVFVVDSIHHENGHNRGNGELRRLDQ